MNNSNSEEMNVSSSDKVLVCSVCKTENKAAAKYCITCGTALATPVPAQAFASISNQEASINESESSPYKAPSTVFAEGLPKWDIIPPQVVVRKR